MIDAKTKLSAQDRAIARWRDPAYRAARAASHAKSMAAIKAGAGFLYVAEVVGTDEVKIGHALNPKRRMKALKDDYFKECRLLKSTPGSLHEEMALHDTLCRFLGRKPRTLKVEFYPRSILNHPAIPEELRVTA
jgi:hypothetical protein